MFKNIDVSDINIDVYNEVMNGIVDLIRHKIFYGYILQQLIKVFFDGEKYGVDTMGVGKNKGELLLKLYISSDFVKYIWKEAPTKENAFENLCAVLEHEVLHIVFDHLNLYFSDRNRGAVAMDLVVNSNISASSLPKCAQLPSKYNFPDNKSVYWYYTNLENNETYKNCLNSGMYDYFGGKNSGCKNNSCGVGDNGQVGIGSHKLWEEVKNDPIMKEFIKNIVKKSVELCNNDYGNVPKEVIQQVDEYLKKSRPIISWNKVLRNFVASSVESNLDYTMKRISKRFGTRPGTRKSDVLNVAVGIDTSGSISDDALKSFLNEIIWIWKNGCKVTVYECDCIIHRKYNFVGKFDGEIHGRGGTDLEPVLEDVEKKYDCLIYFTDFYAKNIEKKYNIPILWVINSNIRRDMFPYKWGRHIKIDLDSMEIKK